MTSAQRWEARVALAMLPIGAVVLVVSTFAFVAVIGLAAAGPFLRQSSLLLLEIWCFVAAVVALWNARTGITLMSSFDWRPLPLVLLRSAAALVGWAALP